MCRRRAATLPIHEHSSTDRLWLKMPFGQCKWMGSLGYARVGDTASTPASSTIYCFKCIAKRGFQEVAVPAIFDLIKAQPGELATVR